MLSQGTAVRGIIVVLMQGEPFSTVADVEIILEVVSGHEIVSVVSVVMTALQCNDCAIFLKSVGLAATFRT